jgi:hypothetical protein
LRDPSGVEDDDAIGHHHGLFAVVRNMYGGDAEAFLQGADFMAHGQPYACVEIGQRLVEKQDFRIDGECAAERHPLALAA